MDTKVVEVNRAATVNRDETVTSSSDGVVAKFPASAVGEINWEMVRRWANWASRYRHGALACQVMAGFGLLSLHEQLRIKLGRHRKSMSQEDRELSQAVNQLATKMSPKGQELMAQFMPTMAQARLDLKKRQIRLALLKTGHADNAELIAEVNRRLEKGSQREPISGSVETPEEKWGQFGPISWKKLVQSELGIKYTNAKRWMQLARAVQKHYRKLPGDERLQEILKVSPGQWTEAEFDFIAAFVHGMAAGKTQVGLRLVLGVGRSPKGDPWAKVRGSLKRYGTHFTQLGVEAVRRQVEELEAALEARRQWLKLATTNDANGKSHEGENSR